MGKRVCVRGKDGKFARIRKHPWTETEWNDGYVNRGRFRVYRPDYPRVYAEGYALRTHVVWWLHTGQVHPAGTNLHHKNGDRLDDRLENLEIIDHGLHSSLHNRQYHAFVCQFCGEEFMVSGQRLASRRSEGRTPKYCSQQCFHDDHRTLTKEHRANISAGLRRWRQGKGASA